MTTFNQSWELFSAGTYDITLQDDRNGLIIVGVSGPACTVSVSTDGGLTFNEVSSFPSQALYQGALVRLVKAASGDQETHVRYTVPAPPQPPISATHLTSDGVQVFAAGGAAPVLEVRVNGVTYSLPLALQHPASVTLNAQSDPGGLYKTHTLPGGFDPAQDTLSEVQSGVLTYSASAAQDSDLAETEFRLVGQVAHYRPVLPTSWDASSFIAGPSNPTMGQNTYYLDPAPANVVSGTTSLRLRDADGNTQELVDQFATGVSNPFVWSVYQGRLFVDTPDDGTNRGGLNPPWQTVEIF